MLVFGAGVVAGLALAVAKPTWARAVNSFLITAYVAIRLRFG